MTIIYQHCINGEHTAGSSTEFFDLISPVTGEVYARSPNANEADVNAAYAAAKTAFCRMEKLDSLHAPKSLARFGRCGGNPSAALD